MSVRRNRRRSTIVALLVLASTSLALLSGCDRPPSVPQPSAAADAWREFHGTWTATGRRHAIPLGEGRQASIADFNGSLVLEGPSSPGRGFRAEAIVLNDTVLGLTGRAVWTDERGDQAFSELRGESHAAGNRLAGTFIGGTGRYAGATGTYEFSWRFLLEGEDGTVQGQSVGLNGRVRFDVARGDATRPATRP